METTWARAQPRGEEEGILQGGVASSVQWGAGVGVRERPVYEDIWVSASSSREVVNWGIQDGEVRGALDLEGGQGVSLDMWIVRTPWLSRRRCQLGLEFKGEPRGQRSSRGPPQTH